MKDKRVVAGILVHANRLSSCLVLNYNAVAKILFPKVYTTLSLSH